MIHNRDRRFKLGLGTRLRGVPAWPGNRQFPRLVEAGITTNVSTITSTPAININSPTAGEMLLVLVRSSGGAGVISFPAGWTHLTQTVLDISDDATTLAYRRCDGAEGATVSLSNSGGTQRYAAVAFRMLNAGTPVLDPYRRFWNNQEWTGLPTHVLWGVRDCLWFCLLGHEGGGGVVDAFPSGFTLEQNTFLHTGSSGAGTAYVGWAIKEERASRQADVDWSFTNTTIGTSMQVQIPPGGSGG